MGERVLMPFTEPVHYPAFGKEMEFLIATPICLVKNEDAIIITAKLDYVTCKACKGTLIWLACHTILDEA